MSFITKSELDVKNELPSVASVAQTYNTKITATKTSQTGIAVPKDCLKLYMKEIKVIEIHFLLLQTQEICTARYHC